MIEITCLTPPVSLARTQPSARPALRIGVVQHRWHADAADLRAELDEGIGRAARLGATVVFLPELTLSRYPADTLPENDTSRTWAPRPRPSDLAEDLLTGPTFRFAAEAARRHGVCIHASLYQRAETRTARTTAWDSTRPSLFRPKVSCWPGRTSFTSR